MAKDRVIGNVNLPSYDTVSYEGLSTDLASVSVDNDPKHRTISVSIDKNNLTAGLALQADLITEIHNREEAVNNETISRINADNELRSANLRISSEVATLNNTLDTEISRAQSRENAIESDLNRGLLDEEAARITEDANIRSDLNDLSDSLSTVAKSGSYNDLLDKPTIGDALITLRRNNQILDTFSVNTTNGSDINIEVPTAVSELYDDLGLASMADVDSLRQEMMDGLGTKQDTLTFDSTPTGGSTNPVTSNGIYRATQAVREVAEGKCKSFTVSCGITLQGIQEAIRDDGLIVYDANGTDITESISDGTHMVFTDGLINPELNSQSADVSTFGYLANSIGLGSGRFVLDTLDNIGFKNGDNLYVVEVNVPDRWYDSTNSYLHILETNKPDLVNVVTTDTTQSIQGNKTFTAPIIVDNGEATYNNRKSTFSPTEWKMSSPSADLVTIKPESIKIVSSTTHSVELGVDSTSHTATIKHGLSGQYTATFPAKSGTVATTDDISNMVTTDTEQIFTAPKSFYNNIANDTLPVRIQGFANRTWGLEMDKDFGRFHLKTANANGTSISNVATQYTFDNGNFYPVGTKNLGTSSNKWTNVFMSGVLSDGNSSYGLSLPDTTSFTANKTIATTDDLPVVPEVPKLYKHIITHSQLGANEKLVIFSFKGTLDENSYLGLQRIVDRSTFVGLIPNAVSDANYNQIIMNRSSGGVNCTGYYFASTTPTSVIVYNPAINGSITDTIEEVSI